MTFKVFILAVWMHSAPLEVGMAHGSGELHILSRHLIWAGFVDLVPLSIFVTLFGAAFGLAAAQEGLGTGVIIGMSAFVFAGAAQFAALELWGAQVSIITLVVTVFAINARHLFDGGRPFIHGFARCHPRGATR